MLCKGVRSSRNGRRRDTPGSSKVEGSSGDGREEGEWKKIKVVSLFRRFAECAYVAVPLSLKVC